LVPFAELPLGILTAAIGAPAEVLTSERIAQALVHGSGFTLRLLTGPASAVSEPAPAALLALLFAAMLGLRRGRALGAQRSRAA
jgi:hypothetical protein